MKFQKISYPADRSMVREAITDDASDWGSLGHDMVSNGTGMALGQGLAAGVATGGVFAVPAAAAGFLEGAGFSALEHGGKWLWYKALDAGHKMGWRADEMEEQLNAIANILQQHNPHCAAIIKELGSQYKEYIDGLVLADKAINLNENMFSGAEQEYQKEMQQQAQPQGALQAPLQPGASSLHKFKRVAQSSDPGTGDAAMNDTYNALNLNNRPTVPTLFQNPGLYATHAVPAVGMGLAKNVPLIMGANWMTRGIMNHLAKKGAQEGASTVWQNIGNTAKQAITHGPKGGFGQMAKSFSGGFVGNLAGSWLADAAMDSLHSLMYDEKQRVAQNVVMVQKLVKIITDLAKEIPEKAHSIQLASDLLWEQIKQIDEAIFNPQAAEQRKQQGAGGEAYPNPANPSAALPQDPSTQSAPAAVNGVVPHPNPMNDASAAPDNPQMQPLARKKQKFVKF